MSHLKVCLSTSFCYIYCLLLTHSSTISPSVTQFHLLSYNCFCFLSSYNMLLSIFLISSFLKFRQTISLGGHLEGLSLHLLALLRFLHLFVSDTLAFPLIFLYTISSSLLFILFSETLMNCF